MPEQTDTNPNPTNNGPIIPTPAKWAAGALVVALVVVGAALMNQNTSGTVSGASTGYQAVFLTNGQVYFGKLSTDKDWINLTDIYYLQVTQNLQQAATSDQGKNATPATDTPASNQPNIQLVKLGSELHGPEDAMHIEKDKVLFWENLKSDSKVISAIAQYQNKK